MLVFIIRACCNILMANCKKQNLAADKSQRKEISQAGVQKKKVETASERK